MYLMDMSETVKMPTGKHTLENGFRVLEFRSQMPLPFVSVHA